MARGSSAPILAAAERPVGDKEVEFDSGVSFSV
jgi:hypothetical protein